MCLLMVEVVFIPVLARAGMPGVRWNVLIYSMCLSTQYSFYYSFICSERYNLLHSGVLWRRWKTSCPVDTYIFFICDID